jgi:integrase
VAEVIEARVPITPAQEKRPFTDDQLAVVLAAAADKDRLLFDTAAETGARWGELCEFRGGDLATTVDGPVLRVQRAHSDKARNSDGKRIGIVKLPKSSAGRRDIPLSPGLARRLWRLQRDPDDLLFTSPRGERMHYQHTRDLVLKPTLARASKRLDGDELGWAGWHTFRHTVASRMFAAGRNVVQVQKWLGHHKPSFTLDTYVHLMGESIGEPLALPEVAERQTRGRRGADKARETGLNAEGTDNPESSTFAG